CFLLAIPGIMERIKKEAENTPQLIIPFEEIKQVAMEEDLPLEPVLKKLRQLGVHSLSLAPVTLKTLAADGEIVLYDQLEFAKLKGNPALMKVRRGSYILVSSHSSADKTILEKLPSTPIFLKEEPYYFLPESSEQVEMFPLGYDLDDLNKIRAAGFAYQITLPAAERFD